MRKRSKIDLRLVLSALGSAVGIANIWGFPYKFEHGGLVFLILFIIFTSIFAISGLSSELAMGRMSKAVPVDAYEYAFRSQGKDAKKGRLLSYVPLIATFFIIIGYCAILAYILKGLVDATTGAMFATEADVWFYSYARRPNQVTIYHGIVIIIAILVIMGNPTLIRKIYRYTMPIFFISLFYLAFRVAMMPKSAPAFYKMFTFNPSDFTISNILYAMGEAFFSLTIFGSAMISAGAVTDDDENLIYLSIESEVFDTLVGLVAALLIIPAIGVFNIENAGGASLLFVALPNIFKNIPFGRAFAILFYLSIVFAGINALTDMFESIADSIKAKHKSMPKSFVLVVLGLLVFILGLRLETIDEFTKYMNVMLLHIIPIGACVGGITSFYILDKYELLREINKAASKERGDLWYKFGRYVYVPLSIILTILALVVRYIL